MKKTERRRLLAGALVAVGLVAAVIVEFSHRPAVTVDTSPPAPGGPAVATASSTPTTSTTTVPAAEVKESIAQVMDATLVAYGHYVGTGDVAVLADHLHPQSPQAAMLEYQASVIAADPPDAPAYVFAMGEPSITITNEGRAIVSAEVTARHGRDEPTSAFWEIVLVRWGDGWRIWTMTDRDL